MAELSTSKIYGDLTTTRNSTVGHNLTVGNDAQVNGDLVATRVYNAVYGDLAEFFYFNENDKIKAKPGQVLIMTKNGVSISNKKADKRVVGIFSDTFGYALSSQHKEKKYPLGLSGRVDVWVKEKIKIGDLLISDKNGFATVKKWYHFKKGIIIGKALQNKDDNKPERISMLILNC